MISEELKEWADSAIIGTYDRYFSDCIEWMVKNCSKREVQKLYSVRKSDINKVYSNYNDYFDTYTKEEAKEAIRAVMVEIAETEVAPRLEAGYTKKSLFRGVTDEEHAKYALKNILQGN